MRGGLVAGVVAAGTAAVGAAFVADRRVRTQRSGAETDRFVPPEPARAGVVTADDGVRLYYEEDGPEPAPLTVVLVHGFCQNRDDLIFQRRALLERFGDDIRLLSPDLRSHGRSGRGSSEHATIDQLGADLATLVDARAALGAVVFVGHSMGGMALLALADRRPELFRERARGVALISTSATRLSYLTLGIPAGLAKFGDPAVRLALRGVRRQSQLIERGRARITDAAWVFTRRLAFGPGVDPDLVEFLSTMIGSTPVDVVADFYPALTSLDKRAALDALVELPAVIVCGEDDVVTPPARSVEMADLLPKAELILVPGAGHQVLMERPDVVDPPLLRLVADALDAAR